MHRLITPIEAVSCIQITGLCSHIRRCVNYHQTVIGILSFSFSRDFPFRALSNIAFTLNLHWRPSSLLSSPSSATVILIYDSIFMCEYIFNSSIKFKCVMLRWCMEESNVIFFSSLRNRWHLKLWHHQSRTREREEREKEKHLAVCHRYALSDTSLFLFHISSFVSNQAFV